MASITSPCAATLPSGEPHPEPRPDDVTIEHPNVWHSILWCGFYGSGITGMLVIYGILQERVMTMGYGDPPEKFKDSVFLVFCNRLVAVIFACGMVMARGEDFVNKAPLWKYLAISFSSVSASTLQYEALKYVSFPVQMLGKSFKMMPVMIWGMIVSGKSYEFIDWIEAGVVTGGVVLFLVTGPIASSNGEGSSLYGLALLAAFLGLDGFTSTFQEKIFKKHETSKYNQMIYINLGSCALSSFTLIASGHLTTAIDFASSHHAFMHDAMTLSAAAVSAQWFIYSQVKEFGALVFAATMNVRQMTSILVSYAKYGHYITSFQIVGLLFVFGALFFKSYRAAKPQSESEKEKQRLLVDKDKMLPA